MVNKLQIGDTVTLEQKSRRSFIKSLTASATGVYGLKQVLTKTYGKEPEGRPLVLTRDLYGNPEKIRIVSPERYQIVKEFENLSENALREGLDHTIRLKQFSEKEDDIGFEILINSDQSEVSLSDRRIRQLFNESRYSAQESANSISTNNREVKININRRRGKVMTRADACGDRGDDKYELLGGLGIAPYSGSTNGTLGIVAFGSDGNLVLITADHVMEGDSKMYQVDSNPVGEFRNRDQSEDVTAYEFTGIGIAQHRAVKDIFGSNMYYLTGYWTFSGLSDYLMDSFLDCTLSGRTSCTVENTVSDVFYNGNRVEHEVNMTERNAQGGDSGGPWVDNDGKLVAFHSGFVYNEYPIIGRADERDVATVAESALNTLNADLMT